MLSVLVEERRLKVLSRNLVSNRRYRSSPRHKTYMACALVVLGVNGCSDDAFLELEARSFGRVGVDLMTIVVTDSRRMWQFTGTDLEQRAQEDGRMRLPTATGGTLEFVVVLADQAIEYGRYEFTLPLRGNWFWSVNIHAADSDPTEGCFGCLERFAFGLDATLRLSPLDSLYVIAGGNYLDDPVIY